jgi:adenylate kinase
MVIIFGAPGAGKSLQGQMLAVRYGWRWLSAGQLLRDTKDPEIINKMSTGNLVDDDITNKLVANALKDSEDFNHVVLDGFPRELSQAKWLVENQPHGKRSISLVIVLEVPNDEIIRRLKLRGRADDKPNVSEERLKVYKDRVSSVVNYFKQMDVPVVHVSGVGSVGEVYNRVESELRTWQLL